MARNRISAPLRFRRSAQQRVGPIGFKVTLNDQLYKLGIVIRGTARMPTHAARSPMPTWVKLALWFLGGLFALMVVWVVLQSIPT